MTPLVELKFVEVALVLKKLVLVAKSVKKLVEVELVKSEVIPVSPLM